MIRVGFIGVGGMGFHQACSFHKVSACRVVAASDPSDESRKRFAAEFPAARVYTNHADLLADTTVDAVVVATPTYFHRAVVIDALKSGRPVLTEKPMGRTVADCHRMNEAAAKTHKLLMVAHCRRYDTDWGAFAKVFRAGALGAPVLWRHMAASNFCPSPWFLDDTLGGGPLFDGAVHNYDFGNMLFGDPQSVLASSVKLTGRTAIDTASAIIRYSSGNQMMVSWSWGVSSTAGGLDVLGPKGTLNWGPGDLATPALDTKKFGYYVVADPGRQKKKLIKFRRTDMYVTQAKHFLDCIAGKAKCLTPGTESIKAVAVAEAILRAAPDGRERKVSW